MARILYVDIEDNVAERFWSKLDRSGDCWGWPDYLNPDGYGSYRISRDKKVPAHRVAYELAKGPIPSGMQIDHLCRNRACCNPDHLEAVTQQENIRRGEVGKNMADKTHCPSGHEYDEANTRINRAGARVCRTCKREHMRRYRREAVA